MEQVIEALQKIPEQLRYVIVLGISALLVALYIFLVRFPAQDELAALVRQYREVQETYQSKQAIADDLQNWQLEIQRLQVTLDEALNQLPNEIDTDQLLISVPNIAKKNALEVLEFELAGERTKGEYAEVPMELKMSGTFRGIGGFAQEVGDQPRIMAVKGLTLKKSSKRGTTPSRGSGQAGNADGENEAAEEGVPLEIEAEVLTYRFQGK